MPTFRSVCRVALVALCAASLLAPPSGAQPFEPTTVELTGTVRDFSSSHPDMQYRIGVDLGITEPVLGPDDKPVYTTTRPFTSTTNGREAFDQWYRDVPGVNLSAPLTIPLTNSEAAPNVFTFDDPDFFPIDGQLLGDQGMGHNYYFTFELHSRFTYRGGEVFTFRGDDDVFVFINQRRVIDLGGVHGPLTGSVNLDSVAGSIGLVVGETYDFDFFFAERYCCGSSFRIQTSITLEQPPPPGGGAALENAGSVTTDHHDPVTVAALLLDDALDPPAGIADSIVTFTLGEQSCQAPTDEDGLASCALTPDLPAGNHPLEIAFAGDVGHPAAALTETFTVTPEETVLTLTSAPVQPGPGALVSAVLREDGALDLAGRTVTFSAGGETVDAVTGPSGTATATFSLPPGTMAVEASFAGDEFHEAATANGSVEVLAPQLSLTPEAQVVSAGSQALVTARVPDLGAPRGGLPVVFTVASGPNAGAAGSCQPADCTTDGSGTVTFSYTGGATAGEDLVTAFLDLDGDGLPGAAEASGSARVLQQALAATVLTYVGATAGDFHDPAEMAAVLEDVSGAPVAGARLAFTLAGESCEASTGADGRAACFVTPAVPAGAEAVAVAFTGTPTLLPSATTADFTVTREQTTLTLALAEAQAAGEVTASATLLEDGAVAVEGRLLTFTAGSTVATTTTDADGTATVDLALGLGVFTVEAGFSGDAFYQPAQAEAGSTVVYEPGQFVIWGGNAPTVAEALTLGQTYEFWGAQWDDQVLAGDYQANASFKGYAATVFPGTFVWETRPGNSSDPPPTVPAYMSVIVATSIAKQGSTIRGNVAAIGVVRVLDPGGYQPNPGHPASGELVALLPAGGAPENPGTSPGAPTAVQAVAGSGSVTVSWQPPSDPGDPPLSGYAVIVEPGGARLAVPAGETSRVVTGLEAGVAYTFAVEAVNAAGAGPASAPSNAVTLVSVPGPPTAVAAGAGDGTITATWQPPASDGGSAVVSYLVTAVPGGATATVPAGTLAAQLTGLANGVTYSVTVAAVNSAGAGPPSAPPATATPLGLPGAPTILGASPGSGQATVYLAGPASGGGAEVTSFVVTASPSGASATVPGSQGFAVVSGLENGTSTTFTAVAVTAAGSGPASAPSAPVVPFGVPGTPAAPTAEGGNASALVVWGVPPSDGGRPVTGYLVTPSPGADSYAAPAAELERLVTELANGTALTFSVAAVNAAGAGTTATTAAVTPATVPDGPVDVAAVAEADGSLTVTWQQPATDGGSAVTSYLVEAHVVDGAALVVASTEVAAPASTATLTGLDLGVEVVVTVRAVNALGTGPQGVPAPPVTPAVPPDPPTDVLAVASAPATATVSWLAPEDDGGSPVTSYTVTSSPGGLTATVNGDTTSAVISGLTLGTSYTFTVAATNSAGDGLPSAPSNALVAATVPDAPTAVAATAGNAQATVSWQAPFDGFSPLSLYTVTASPGGATATVNGATTSAVVGGLANGTTYTFTVTATNGVGTSAPSAPSNAVTPATVPGAPTAVTAALAGDRAVEVSWAPPASDGGSGITAYTVTSNPGGLTATVAAPATTATVSSLLAGTTYTFTVRASNDRGEGPPSAPSNPVTAASGPGAPTAVTAVAGDGEATVSWSPPASDGGSGIVSYTVVSSPGAVSVTVGGGVTTAVVGGLTNGITYTFTVTAANAVGAGPPSAPSNAVTPATVPGAPTGATAQVGGDAAALVSWTPPADNGGAPVQSYSVTSSPGGLTATAVAPATSAVVSGLTLGTSYTFTVTATNAAGPGPPSAPSNAVTAVSVPDAPTAVTATAGDAEATVSWTAPPDPAGQPVTGYTVTSSPGGISVTVPAPATSATVGGLTNGTTYTFTVTATNAVGNSPPSAPSNAVTPQPGGVVALSSLAVTPARVESGEPATGTVTLTEPAPAGGMIVTLASSGPAATVPATVTVLEGDLAADFTVTTASVTITTEVNLSASLDGTTITVVFTVDPIAPGTPPTAEIDAPLEDAVVTGPEDVLGTATAADFVSYLLEYSPLDSGTFVEIASSASPVSGGVLGVFDGSLLPNGIYLLRLTVETLSGAQATAERTLEVSGERKVGPFRASFEDKVLPIGSFPLRVVRSYDSTDKLAGDFGVGWSLGLNRAVLMESRALGTAWEQVSSGGTFPNFSLVATAAHTVTIRFDSETTVQFAAVPSPSSQQLVPIRFLNSMQFVPLGTTRGTLTPAEQPFQVIPSTTGPVEIVDDVVELYNPSSYVYEAPDGFRYVFDETFFGSRRHELVSITDPNGITLTLTPTGLLRSDGLGISFVRDAAGRITSLQGPNGGQVLYEYDAAGDLAAVTDEEGNRTTFVYDGDHNLIEILDPSGQPVQAQEYDPDGRLVALEDPTGGRIEMIHDLAANLEVVVDRRGNQTVYAYDANGNVEEKTELTQVDGVRQAVSTTYTYDGSDRLLTLTDSNGVVTAFTYDSAGNVLSETTDPGGLGLVTSFTYDSAGRVLTVTDPRGNIQSNTYDANGNLLTRTDRAGETTTYAYDGRGLVVLETDPLGNYVERSYDGVGNLTLEEEFDSAGTSLRRREMTYDANGNVLTETIRGSVGGQPFVATTTYEYDGNDQQVAVIDPLGNRRETEYDGTGRIVAEIDARGNRTELDYDSRGNLVTVRHPDGTTESFGYDADGNRTSVTDRDGNTTFFEFDAAKHIVRTVLPGGLAREIRFDAAGHVIAEIDERGERTDHLVDALGRRVFTTQPAVLDGETGATVRPVTFYEYDGNGNRTAVVDARGHRTEFVYDGENRRTSTVYPDGRSISTAYDALGREVSRTDAAGLTTDLAYDALGRLVSVLLPSASGGPRRSTTYTYDLLDHRISQTDALGRTTLFEVDLAGRQTARELPGGQRETFTYDAAGNLTAHAAFDGTTTTHVYDTAHRRIRTDFPDGTSRALTYTGEGAPLTATDAAGSTAYAYDSRARLQSTTDVHGRTVSYTYDPSSQVASVTGPGGATTYGYDALGRLSAVEDAQGGVTTYEYDLVGNLVRTVLPTGAVTTQTYNARNQLTAVEHRRSDGVVLQSFTYTLDANGLRTRVQEADGSAVDYVYDGNHRLVRETRTGTAPYDVQYAYDAVGNRVSLNRNGSVTNYSYDVNDRLLTAGSETSTYDPNGNLLTRTDPAGTTTYAYDAEDRLVGLTDPSGATATYRYDAFGNRASRTDGSGTAEFVVDVQGVSELAQVLEERDAAGALTARYTTGLSLLSQFRAGGASYYHADGTGSVRALTDPLQVVTDTYVYDAYGEEVASTGSTPNDFRYVGEELDPNSGFYYLRARYYDPATGRFISIDPFLGDPQSPISLHRYLYANDNPVNFTDPTGLFTIGNLSVSLQLQSNLQAVYFKQLITFGFDALKIAACVIEPGFIMREHGLLDIAIGDPAGYVLYEGGGQMIRDGTLQLGRRGLGIYKKVALKTFDVAFRYEAEHERWRASLKITVQDVRKLISKTEHMVDYVKSLAQEFDEDKPNCRKFNRLAAVGKILLWKFPKFNTVRYSRWGHRL